MCYRLCKLYGTVFAMGIGVLGKAYALDFPYPCDDVLYSAKVSGKDYQVHICMSGDKVNFNYGPIKGSSEVNVLLSKKSVYYVPHYREDGTASGKVGLMVEVGRYRYFINNNAMTLTAGNEGWQSLTQPLQRPVTDLNVAQLVKYKLKPE